MRARDLRTEKERLLFGIAVAVSAVVWLVLLVTVIGAIYGAVIGLFVLAAHALFLARVSIDGVRIGPDQLPDLHEKVQRAARELGMERAPEAYLVQGDGLLNAFATKLLSRRYVILLADLVQAAEASAEPDAPPGSSDALDFVIAHEVGHLAAGHLQWNAFLLPARVMPWLGPAYSRACEYTCDRCGYELVQDETIAARAIAVLAAGTTARRVSLEAFRAQDRDAGGFWESVVELNATHPFLPKRIAAIEEMLRPGTRPPAPRNVLAYPLAPVFSMLTGGAGAGLLGVVAIVGILAAVAIPNLLVAVDASKAKRTMTDLETVATALEARATDTNEYPPTSSLVEIAPLLVPTYVKSLPMRDGWGHELRYEIESGGSGYAVGSPGKLGEWDSSSLWELPEGPTSDYDSDIVFANGRLTRYPVRGGAERP